MEETTNGVLRMKALEGVGRRARARAIGGRLSAAGVVLRTSIVVVLGQFVWIWGLGMGEALAAELSTTLNSAVERKDFWSHDVWLDPDRPFLFYGESRESSRKDERTDATGRREDWSESVQANEVAKDDPLAIFPADGLDRAPEGRLMTMAEEAEGLKVLTAITTVKALREETERRLEAAVMRPTPKAIGLYLQANAFLMQKAGVFAESWRRALVNYPRFDWTAVRPAVNAVSASVSHDREGRMLREVAHLHDDYGFIFFGDKSILTRHMVSLVRDFVSENNFEVAFVTVDGDNPLMPEAREDKGLTKFVARGITQFPALVLVSRFEKDLTKAKLVATGSADAMMLVRNTWAAVQEYERERQFVGANGDEPVRTASEQTTVH